MDSGSHHLRMDDIEVVGRKCESGGQALAVILTQAGVYIPSIQIVYLQVEICRNHLRLHAWINIDSNHLK